MISLSRLCTSSDSIKPLSCMAMNTDSPPFQTESLSVDSIRLSRLPASSSCSHSAIFLLNFQALRHMTERSARSGCIVFWYSSAGLSTESKIILFMNERKPASPSKFSLLVLEPWLPATESSRPRHMLTVSLSRSFRFLVDLALSERPISYAVDFTTVWYIWRQSWKTISR